MPRYKSNGYLDFNKKKGRKSREHASGFVRISFERASHFYRINYNIIYSYEV